VYILIWLWVKLVEKRPFSSLGLAGKGAFLKFGRGLGVGLIMFVITVALLSLFGFYTVQAGLLLQVSTVGGILIVLLGWLVQGPAEEILFRGWVLPVLSARYKLWLGFLLSSLMFAALHSLNPNLSVVAMVNLFLFGLFTAFYAFYEESVWGVFGIHAVWNWVQGNVFGLEVSGTPVVGGSLLVLREAGPDLLTGGAFGPEGGLAVTLVLGLAIAIVLVLDKKGTDVGEQTNE
jgi:hypothetical protein